MPDPRTLGLKGAVELLAACNSTFGFTRTFWPVIEPGRAFVPGWHVGNVCEHLDWVGSGGCQNIIINIPPRCMKSLLVCVFWFCKQWLADPSSRWMFSSFAQDLVQRDSQRCRDVLRHPLYQFLSPLRVKNDQDTQLRFTNQFQGFRYAVTVAGQGMGEGADYIVVDDPINPRRAQSAVERAKCIHWWTSTMQMRANDPATCRKIIIMQRLHERDLTGYLMAEQTGWEHLVLPMRYEPRRFFLPDVSAPSGPVKGGDGVAEVGPLAAPELPEISGADPASLAAAAELIRKFVAEKTATPRPRDAIVPTALQRRRPELMDGSERSGRQQEGDLLWPRRFPEPVVAKNEVDLGIDAPGQYQQRPSAEAGEIFLGEFFRRYESLWDTDAEGRSILAGVRLHGPAADQVREFPAASLVWFQTIDTALTESKRSAYTAVGTFCATPQFDLIVWDMFRAKMAVPYQFPACEDLRAGPCVWERKARRVVRCGDWPARMLFQAIEAKASGIGLIQQAAAAGKPFHPLTVDGDKVQRAGPVATMYRNGKVYHPAASRPWVVQMEDELLTFPNGTYKDQADVIAYGGYLVTHDKLIRTFCADRIVADVPPLDGAFQVNENTVNVPTQFGPISVQFPDDDDGIFDLFSGRQR